MDQTGTSQGVKLSCGFVFFCSHGGMLTRPESQRDGEVLYVGMQWHVGLDGGLAEKLLLWITIWFENHTKRLFFKCNLLCFKG